MTDMLSAFIPFWSPCRPLLILMLAMAGSLFAAEAADLNQNSGFETLRQEGDDGSPFEAWGFYGGFQGGKYSIEASKEAHGGSRSGVIQCVRKGRAGLSTAKVEVMPGTLLEVSCHIKTEDATNGRLFLNFEGSPGDGWSTRELKTGTYDWTEFTHQVVVPEGEKAGPQIIVVYFYTSCEGTVWMDDFTVRAVEAPGPVAVAATRKGPAAIPRPEGAGAFRLRVAPALERVFLEDDFQNGDSPPAAMEAAGNETESLQLVVEAPWEPVRIESVEISSLTGPENAVIPAAAFQWQRVGYVRTTKTPPYFAERGLGNYADPLLSASEFSVDARSRAPLLITVKTPAHCLPGGYSGTITVTASGQPPEVIPIRLTVWDVTLPERTHLRTMTWLSEGNLKSWYRLGNSPEDQRTLQEILCRYEDCLLEHRLGPGGEVVPALKPAPDGSYDFTAVNDRLSRLIGKGMNAFLMGSAPNFGREKKTGYSPEFVESFTRGLAAFGQNLTAHGWSDAAYVYVYDEAPESAWPEVRKICDAIHAAYPPARILQCLNEPAGVRALTGYADVFDIYIPHYHVSGVAEAVRRGGDAWLAVCCYPMEHPNLFLEYPLLDARVMPWLCWKYGVGGLEYWSPVSWGPNIQPSGKQWPDVPWIANCFRNYNGDGWLLYPGPDGKPLSSLRLEALRDGFEDYEYLWMLRELVQEATERKLTGAAVSDARKLLTLEGVVKESGSYSPDPAAYAQHRRAVVEACVRLRLALADR